MKKLTNLKRDTILKIVLLLLIVVVFVLLMVQPERFGYHYSMKDIQNKKLTFESLNTQILSEQQMLVGKQNEYDMFIEDYNAKQQNSLEIENKLNMADLGLHIPSLLLVLEEEAVKNDLNIHIRYDEKKLINNNHMGYDSNEGMSYDSNEGMVNDMDVDPSSGDIQGSDIYIEYENNPSGIQNDNTGGIDTIEPIEGLNILVLPIEIEGTYKSLRNYISFLDSMDFIIPYSINVETQGGYVIGELIVQIFYQEGGTM